MYLILFILNSTKDRLWRLFMAMQYQLSYLLWWQYLDMWIHKKYNLWDFTEKQIKYIITEEPSRDLWYPVLHFFGLHLAFNNSIFSSLFPQYLELILNYVVMNEYLSHFPVLRTVTKNVSKKTKPSPTRWVSWYDI